MFPISSLSAKVVLNFYSTLLITSYLSAKLLWIWDDNEILSFYVVYLDPFWSVFRITASWEGILDGVLDYFAIFSILIELLIEDSLETSDLTEALLPRKKLFVILAVFKCFVDPFLDYTGDYDRCNEWSKLLSYKFF